MSFTSRRISKDVKRRVFPWHRAVRWTFEFGAAAAATYRAWKERRIHEEHVLRLRALLKRALIILFGVLLALMLLAGTARALLGIKSFGLQSFFSVATVDLPKDAHGHMNVLLLGQGDATHDGVDLTDSIMIASIDTSGDSAVLLSIPRDLYFLETGKMGAGRINSLYRDYKSFLRFREGMDATSASYASMRQLGGEVGAAFGMPIHHVLKVDFVGFVKAVDAIGGVDIDVPADIVDTQYPAANYTYETFSLKAGPQHLDGETALKYARSRHTSSDFDRSSRQQQLLAALAAKVRKEKVLRSPATIAKLLEIAGRNIETTMGFREILTLAKTGANIPRERILTMQLSDRSGLFDGLSEPGGFLYAPPRDFFEGASVLLPVSVPEFPITWKQIQTLVRLVIDTRWPTLARPSFVIRNAGARSGMGSRLGMEFVRYGYTLEDVGNAERRDLANSTIAAPAAQEEVARFFGGLLGIPVQTEEGAQAVTITLGKDYTFVPFQDLPPPPQ